MLANVAERKMRFIRAFLAFGWIIIIISLFWDPITPLLTVPDNISSPFHLTSTVGAIVQGEEITQAPYPMGTRFFWTMLIPLVPLFLMLFGHEAWRRLCPLSFLMQIPRYLNKQYYKKQFNRRNGKIDYKLNILSKNIWVQKNHWYLQFSLLFIALCNRILFVNSNATALAIFMISIIAIAMAVGYFFGGKTWCNYICPIGIVQKIYTEPGGVLESKAHLQKQTISQSMCRTSSENGDKSICVACTKNCPDIDLESSYWNGIENSARRFVYYGFFGLVSGFYGYYYLYSGNWDYYFSGIWTHETNQLQQLFSPGFYFSGQSIAIPKILAAPLTLALFVITSYLLGSAAEKIYRLIRIKINRPLDNKDLLNHCFSVSAFLSINVFYIFGGRPNLMLLPDPMLKLVDMSIIFISTVWLWKALSRSYGSYHRESLVNSMLIQLKKLSFDFKTILEGRSLDDLKADEVYVLAKTLPGFTRDQKLSVYKNVLSEALNTGKMNSSNSLSLLKDARAEMGISDDEHSDILQQLGIEDGTFLDPDKMIDQENWLRLENYKESISEIISNAVNEKKSMTEILSSEDISDKFTHLKSLYQISDDEHLDIMTTLSGDENIIFKKLENNLDKIKQLSSDIYLLQQQPARHYDETLQFIVRVLLKKRLNYADHYIHLLNSLGDSLEARLIARNLRVFIGTDIHDLLETNQYTLDSNVLDVLNAISIPDFKALDKAQPHQLLHPASYADITALSGNIESLLENLCEDSNAILVALALHALASINLPLALKKLASIDVSRHWLLEEMQSILSGTSHTEEQKQIVGIVLTIKPENQAEYQREFFKPVVSIGKSFSNDIIIYDANIANYQAIIRQTAEGPFLSVLSKAQPLYLNGKPCKEDYSAVASGDVIHFYPQQIGVAITVNYRQNSDNNYYIESQDSITKLSWLMKVPMFRHLDLHPLAEIAKDTEVRIYHKNGVLCHQGESSNEAYLLQSGSTVITQKDADNVKVINHSKENDIIGEIGIISQGIRSATVTVDSQNATVLVISGRSISQLIDQDNQVAKVLLKQLSSYIQNKNSD